MHEHEAAAQVRRTEDFQFQEECEQKLSLVQVVVELICVVSGVGLFTTLPMDSSIRQCFRAIASVTLVVQLIAIRCDEWPVPRHLHSRKHHAPATIAIPIVVAAVIPYLARYRLEHRKGIRSAKKKKKKYKFEGRAPKLIAYAGGIAIRVTGKFQDTISSVMNCARKQTSTRSSHGVNY